MGQIGGPHLLLQDVIAACHWLLIKPRYYLYPTIPLDICVMNSVEILNIIKIISISSESLENILAQFNQRDSKDYIRALKFLCVLLEDDLLTHPQRLVSIFLLSSLKGWDILDVKVASKDSFPFLHFLIDLLESLIDDRYIIEKKYLIQVIGFNSSIKERMIKQNIITIIQGLERQNTPIQVPDFKVIKSMYIDQIFISREKTNFETKIVRPIVSIPSIATNDGDVNRLLLGGFNNITSANNYDIKCSRWSEQDAILEANTLVEIDSFLDDTAGNMSSCKGLVPTFLRPIPPLMDDEICVTWVSHEHNNNTYSWKPLMPKSVIANDFIEKSYNSANALMMTAISSSLNPNQQQELIKEIKDESKLLSVKACCLPNKLPELIENNPRVGVEFVLKVLNSIQSDEYLASLVKTDITLHSIEVVKELSTTLPIEFLQSYINHCISSCGNIKNNFKQNRSVRLVCVFLKNLIRNKIISAQDCSQDLFFQIQTFCIEFSKIKEAAEVFTLLKSFEFV